MKSSGRENLRRCFFVANVSELNFIYLYVNTAYLSLLTPFYLFIVYMYQWYYSSIFNSTCYKVKQISQRQEETSKKENDNKI
jgi:hypothetical protein